MTPKTGYRRRDGLHTKGGLFFVRLDDGTVGVRLQTFAGHDSDDDRVVREILLTESEWASAVASVSMSGENGETWQAARDFHGGFTGRASGWAVSEFVGEHNAPEPHWHWWARHDGEVREGHEPTWAQAVGIARAAYEKLAEA